MNRGENRLMASAIIMVAVLLLSLMIFVMSSCVEEAYGAPPHLVSVALWQDADSARFVITWQARALRPGQAPIAFYYTRIIDTESRDTIAMGTVDRFTVMDTVSAAWPARGDTIPVQAMVASVDADGDMSPWARSRVVPFGVGIVPPDAPDSVGIFQLDSIPMALDIRERYVRPAYIYLHPGETEQVCSIVVFYNDSSGFHIMSKDSVRFDDSVITYCQTVYNRWLLERAA